MLHARFDDIVGLDNATRIFEAARHPKSFLSLDDADHLLRDDSDARYASNLTRGVSIGRDRFRTDVRAAGHVIVADEPVEVGGGGLGPSPYDLLLASLGTCTAITLRM